MSTTATTYDAARPDAPSAGLFTSTLVITRRALTRFFRTPQEVIAGTATTAMFMLIFLYVFGGEIDIPGVSYVDFLVPGFLTAAVLFTGMGTAAAVAADLEEGFVDRVRSLPISRLSFLAGRAVADTGVLVWSLFAGIVIGVVVGFRIHGPLTDALLAVGLLVVIGFAFIWLFIVLGLFAGTAKGAQGLSFMVFPLSFVSSAYVRVESLPGVLQPFAEHQPLTVMIDAVRALTLGPAGEALLDHSAGFYITRSLLWVLGILVVSIPLAVIRFNRGK
ncbi:ABC transporter permease [Phytoactinopolyspora mesophila]|uniref:Transport permease protein n=1 Tax=Phytoactinopolyspora mesophila TaxID=2650750 RepID=A0A7K3MCE5_9ACTN|nr:ABC transporter permease [Phytoactinopolyspora mesophila]NDL60642.1 ABC transporter permease [Phytoactinopolyspora mesophila]